MDDVFDANRFLDAIDKSRRFVRKSLKTAKWSCCVPGCDCQAINSHVVQQHPILESICVDNKVWQICDNDKHPQSGDWNVAKLKLLGITEALSMPLFCKEHDSELFKLVEKKEVDYGSVEVQTLLTYRALCSKLVREKIKNAKYRMNSKFDKTFDGEIFREELMVSDYIIDRLTSSMKEMWNCMQTHDYSSFVFNSYQIDNFGFCASDVCLDESDLEAHVYDDNCVEPVWGLFIHILPISGTDTATLIVGTRRGKCDKIYSRICKEFSEPSTIKQQYRSIYRLLLMIDNFAVYSNVFLSQIASRLKFEEQYISDKIDAL